MIKFILYTMCIFIAGNVSFAKLSLKIPTNQRKPATTDGELGAKIFISFLNCGSVNEPVTDVQRFNCVNKIFSKTVTPTQINKYMEALTFPNEYSEPFVCDSEKDQMIKLLEEAKYDTYLCFVSNISNSSSRTGIIFFKKESGSLKILKIKM